jgi:hypothetical protein
MARERGARRHTNEAMTFEQAVIKVEKEKEFAELKRGIELAFQPERVEKILKRLQNKRIRVRDFDSILRNRVLDEQVGSGAQELYQSLTVPDQAQIREFYLFRIEQVDPKLRTKFHKIYQYY